MVGNGRGVGLMSTPQFMESVMKFSEKIEKEDSPNRALEYELELYLKKLKVPIKGNRFMSSYVDAMELIPSHYELYGIYAYNSRCKLVSDIGPTVKSEGSCSIPAAITIAALKARGM